MMDTLRQSTRMSRSTRRSCPARDRERPEKDRVPQLCGAQARSGIRTTYSIRSARIHLCAASLQVLEGKDGQGQHHEDDRRSPCDATQYHAAIVENHLDLARNGRAGAPSVHRRLSSCARMTARLPPRSATIMTAEQLYPRRVLAEQAHKVFIFIGSTTAKEQGGSPLPIWMPTF